MIPADERTCPAGSTPHITFTLKNHADSAIPLASMDTLQLTLWDEATGTIIRDSQNVLNTNNVTMHATTGAVEWLVRTTDTALVSADPNIPRETRRFEFAFTWTESGTSYTQKAPAYFYVTNTRMGIS